MPSQYFCHFSALRWTESYWARPAEERAAVHRRLLEGLRSRIDCFALYPLFAASPEADLLLWSTFVIDRPEQPAEAFSSLAELLSPLRAELQPVRYWWGFTRPSDYAKGRSAQEIDPTAPEHKRYLVVYPFTKTAEWYRLGRDTRQGMMNEHIRTGHQYPQITQLLLYSTGLQDQEFVVVYETDELPQFSSLVSELRSSEARRFTAGDTPVYTAAYYQPAETLALFEGK